MRVLKIIDEDFTNYKLPSMFISAIKCSFKCEKECGIKCCQNNGLINETIQKIDDDKIILRYLNNPITSAIIFGGLEPFEQFDEVFEFITKIRNTYGCNDAVIIYTGFKEYEIADKILKLSSLSNIIIKFGRFIPNQQPHFDNVLGVNLASDNQYGKII